MRNARTLMTAYRQYILNKKRHWNLQLISQGRPPSRRAARALLYYRNYLDAYLKAKRAVVAGEEEVDA